LLLVTAALIVTDGKILAARRASNRHLAGFWEFPGGKVETGESPEPCLAREFVHLSKEVYKGSLMLGLGEN
jgi:8-oxo-dGTP diphosphatase